MEISKENISAATLLSLEEFNDNKDIIPVATAWWWLRSRGAYSNKAAYVFIDGDVYPEGYDVSKEKADVRPAFEINPKIAGNIAPGEKIQIGKYDATMLKGGICLLDDCVCKHRFDEKSGMWDGSEIKNFIESEEFLEMIF